MLQNFRMKLRVPSYLRLLLFTEPTTIDNVLLVVGAIAAVVSGIPFPLVGILFGNLIDDFNSATCDTSPTTAQAASTQRSIDHTILLVVYLAIAQFVAIWVHLTCWSLRGARLAERLREYYFRSLLSKEIAFFDSLPAGEVSTRLTSDIQMIRAGTSEKVGIVISSTSFFVTAYAVAFIKHARLAGMLVSLIPAYMVMSLAGGHYIEKFSGLVSDHVASAASIASESLSNLLVVHAFGLNERLERKFAEPLLAARQAGIRKSIATGVQSGLMYFIAYAGNALAFWQGSRIVAGSVGGSDMGGGTVGSIFTVIFILVDATLVLSQVAPFLQIFGAASGSFSKLQKDINRASTIDSISETKGEHVSDVQGELEFRHVSYAYASRPDTKVLKVVSATFPAGTMTAIVGLSGSGKSTVTALATRLYDPTAGVVCLDGKDIRQINTRQLRSLISVVHQEPSLLDRSLLENIAHGLVSSPAHDHLKSTLLGPELQGVAEALRNGEDIMTVAESKSPEVLEIVKLSLQASRNVDAWDFITRLREGFGTVVGTGGRLLSGGQRQRIALARAIIKDPKILILDEATSALDSTTEQKIVATVKRIAVGKTVIAIAHRISAIKHADNIILMRDGVIVEQGAHDELMAREDGYAKLVRMQDLTSSGVDAPPSSASTLNEASAPNSSIDRQNCLKRKSDEKEGLDLPTLGSEKAEKKEEDSSEPEEQEFTPKKSVLGLFRGLWPMIRPHILAFIIALVASSIVGAAFSAEAVIFGNTVSALSPCQNISTILSRGDFFGLMFFVLAIIEFFANFVSWSAFGWVAEKTLYATRILSFRSLFEQDMHWHQSGGRTPPRLLSIITSDGSLLGGLSGSVIGVSFSIFVNLIVAIVLTNVIAWKVALVCLAIVPLLLGVGLMQLRVLTKFEERHETAYASSVGIGTEAVNQIKTIASLSLEHETMAVYQRTLTGPRKEIVAVTVHASSWLALSYFVGNLSYALAYWWGSTRIIAGEYTQTQFLIVVFSLLVSAQLWSEMFALAPEISNAKGAASRILSLLERGSSHKKSRLPSAGAIAVHASSLKSERLSDFEGGYEQKPIEKEVGVGVTFEDVKFAYPSRPDAQILEGLSLSIHPGQFCALVGPSGAGKSTIISLIERMYTPSSGIIKIGGVEITARNDTSFRDDMALVPQDSLLFEGSIRFNVGLGARPGQTVSDAEIEDACRLANIHELITSLPEGYDTACGPNGGRLSGGQKQRLSIARALVRKPRLLILDEPTSALDAESEKTLQDGLDQASLGITVVVIAHRLHTIQKADVIFLIEAGQCIDSGTHAELSESSESYRANVLHQQLGGIF